MKRIFSTIILASLIGGAYAQQTTTVTVTTTKSDTVKVDSVKKKKKSFEITIGGTDNGIETGRHKDSLAVRSKRPGASFDFTFSRFDIGFSKLVDNGSFTLSGANRDMLEYKGSKTSNVGFDVLQFGYRFNSYFKIYVAGGFDWTHIRLENDVTILQDQPTLSYKPENVKFEKNRFSSSYLRIPLAFDIRSKDDKRGKKFHFVAGPEVGFLLNGKVKQISSENGKQKFKDDYHFTQFRYGAVARVGYGGAGLYFKQYFNDMFENSPAQKGLKNMAFGLTIGF